MFEKQGIKPHCSSCGHELKYYEYFPVLSWISTKFKCNYCGVKIDLTYTFLEVSIMLASIFMVIYMGMDINYVMATLVMAVAILNIVFFVRYKKIFTKAAVLLLCSIIIYFMVTKWL